MKLNELFVGKLVQGTKGKVVPVTFDGLSFSEEPIGVVEGFEYICQLNMICPIVWWIGENKSEAHAVHPENLKEVEQ